MILRVTAAAVFTLICLAMVLLSALPTSVVIAAALLFAFALSPLMFNEKPRLKMFTVKINDVVRIALVDVLKELDDVQCFLVNVDQDGLHVYALFDTFEEIYSTKSVVSRQPLSRAYTLGELFHALKVGELRLYNNGFSGQGP